MKTQQVHYLQKLLDQNRLKPERDAVILDLACGTGDHLFTFLIQGRQGRGIDINPYAIKVAEKRALGNWIALDLERAPDRERTFADLKGRAQLVYMVYGTWCTLSPPTRIALMDEISRALAPGGVFVFDGFTYMHRTKDSQESSFKDAPLLESSESYWSDWGGFWGFFPTPITEEHWHFPRQALRAEMYTLGGVKFCTWKQGMDPHLEGSKILDRYPDFEVIDRSPGSFGVNLPPEEGGKWFTLALRKTVENK
ncbi:MAG: class I SAM-dependent methyltransferase [Spirochaetales bacterium]|nr:class I SAM-dependent methyltransferase [Spirochaetales bacterium]